MEFSDQGEAKHIVSDIVLDKGIAKDKGLNHSVYALYEVELTIKPLGHYQDFLNKVSLHNKRLSDLRRSYLIGQVNFVVPKSLFAKLENVIGNTKSDVPVCLFDESEVLSERCELRPKQLSLPRIKGKPSEEL
jgi:hypothetical protein